MDIIHRIGIRAPLATVQRAVATADGIAGWLTAKTAGDPGAGGTVISIFESPDGREMGRIGFEITRNEPGHVVWRITSGPEEWVGTDLTFDLAQEGEYTVVLFGHRNWRKPTELMAHSSMKWATFLLSLIQFVETGKGEAAPYDRRVGNWS